MSGEIKKYLYQTYATEQSISIHKFKSVKSLLPRRLQNVEVKQWPGTRTVKTSTVQSRGFFTSPLTPAEKGLR